MDCFELQTALEAAASIEGIDMWKPIIGRGLGDSGMGMCGLVSSLLTFYEGALLAIEEEKR
jgi:hypothetical protein